jgi:hypothetical protein
MTTETIFPTLPANVTQLVDGLTEHEVRMFVVNTTAEINSAALMDVADYYDELGLSELRAAAIKLIENASPDKQAEMLTFIGGIVRLWSAIDSGSATEH